MNDELDLEGSGRGLLELLSRYLPGGIEENFRKLRQDSRCPGRDSNRAHPKYKSMALPLDQTVLYLPYNTELADIPGHAWM
jgi:hypothetical protein